MLILTRGPGERIMIELPDGRIITIGVSRTGKAGQTRLSIDAPRDVEVHREEVFRLRAGNSDNLIATH